MGIGHKIAERGQHAPRVTPMHGHAQLIGRFLVSHRLDTLGDGPHVVAASHWRQRAEQEAEGKGHVFGDAEKRKAAPLRTQSGPRRRFRLSCEPARRLRLDEGYADGFRPPRPSGLPVAIRRSARRKWSVLSVMRRALRRRQRLWRNLGLDQPALDRRAGDFPDDMDLQWRPGGARSSHIGRSPRNAFRRSGRQQHSRAGHTLRQGRAPCGKPLGEALSSEFSCAENACPIPMQSSPRSSISKPK